MRIIVFAITLFLGIYTSSFFKPSATPIPCDSSNVYERGNTSVAVNVVKSVPYYNSNIDASNNYTKDEALALIGKQVRNLSHNNSKCPKESGNCLELFDGESGTIVGMLPSMNNTFMLEILWNQNGDNNLNRDKLTASYVSYVGKELSIKVIK